MGRASGEEELPLPSLVSLTRPLLPSACYKGATSSGSFTGDFGMRETE